MDPAAATERGAGHVYRALTRPLREIPGGEPITLRFPLDDEQISELIYAFRNQQRLKKESHVELLSAAEAYFRTLPNIQTFKASLTDEVIVVGDLHGLFFELLEVFRRSGLPRRGRTYVFNGDLVDRGPWGCEIVLLLCALAVARRGRVLINRGNHESKFCTAQYGFQKELRAKYGKEFVPQYMRLFCALPLGTLLRFPHDFSPAPKRKAAGPKRSTCIFVVHGGLPARFNVRIADIQAQDRFVEPRHGLVAQLLWTDPRSAPGAGVSNRPFCRTFGPDLTRNFLSVNAIHYVIRSHGTVNGHRIHHAHGRRLVTIFSVPDAYGPGSNVGQYIVFRARDPIEAAERWNYQAVRAPASKPAPHCAASRGCALL